jgi:hypothetical protein
MTKINDGGAAFPRGPIGEDCDKPYGHQKGMTLRDWFAGQALPQAVEDYGQPEHMKSTGQRRDRGNPVLPYATAEMSREQIIALQAYRYADAMIAARGDTP